MESGSVKRVPVFFITMIFLYTVFFSQNYAIISGINDYKYLCDLQYAEKDVDELEEALKYNGFSVIPIKGEDATFSRVVNEIRNTAAVSKTDDHMIFFFSGHGRSGENESMKGLMLHDCLPDDTNDFLSQEILKNELVQFKGKTIVVIDACFQGNTEKAFVRKPFSDEGFYSTFDFLLTSSAANQSSHDGFYTGNVKVENGVAAYYLIRAVEGEADANRDNFLSANELNNYFNNHAQFMARNNGQDMEVYFKSEEEKLLALNIVKNIPLVPQKILTENNVKMVLVKGGQFLMGNAPFQNNNYVTNDEIPSHYVILTYDFWMSSYEITFASYDEYCENTGKIPPKDCGFGRGLLPVVNVEWYDAINYCNWLSVREGLPVAYDSSGHLLNQFGEITDEMAEVMGYRLPTEAEWEYAARGGAYSKMNRFSGSGILDEVAWYNQNGEVFVFPDGREFPAAKPGGLKQPNEIGLYDMTGNVYEWCQDGYDPFWYKKNTVKNPVNLQASNYRILRGGSTFTWDFEMDNAERHFTPTDGFYYDVGFRIVRTDKTNQFVNFQIPEWKKSVLEISSVPTGAIVFLDGRKYPEKTPCEIELVEGFYKISLEKEGYNPHREVLYLKTSENRSIKASLKNSAQNAVYKIFLPEEVYVKGGSFCMGDHYGDLWREAQPSFPVELTYDYYMGKYETTNEEFLSYLNDRRHENTINDSLLEDVSLNFSPFFPECFLERDENGYFYMPRSLEKRPVVMLLKNAVFDYCNWLSEKYGLHKAYDEAGNLIDRNGNRTDNVLNVEGYRLPTEAEWEFAALGGQFSQGYRFAGGNVASEIGWGWTNSGDTVLNGPWDREKIMCNNCRLHDVGLKQPNELGIYDMSGNAWEMCQDSFTSYDESNKINPYTAENFIDYARRGGSFGEEIPHLAIQHRFKNDFDGRNNDLGFRIARTAIKRDSESDTKFILKNLK